MSKLVRSFAAAAGLAVALVAGDALATHYGSINYTFGQTVVDLSGLSGGVDTDKTPKAGVNIGKISNGNTWSGSKWVAGPVDPLPTVVANKKWTPGFTLPSGIHLQPGDYKITLTTQDAAGKAVGEPVSLTVTVLGKKTSN